jgi:hypothetical protein
MEEYIKKIKEDHSDKKNVLLLLEVMKEAFDRFDFEIAMNCFDRIEDLTYKSTGVH